MDVKAPLPLLRTSERSALKRCPQRWWWAYREGLRPTGAPKQPLWFGTGIHLALAEWYIPGRERGRNPKDTFAEYAKDSHELVRTSSTWRGDPEDEFTNALELGIDMFDGYLKEYGRDDHWEVIAPEQTFAVLIPGNDESRNPVADYRGTFDGVYFDLEDRKYYVMEHKSAAQLGVSHLPLDDQAGSYFAIATHLLRQLGLIPPKATLAGVHYNFLIKKKQDKRPRDLDGRYHNKPQKAHYIEQMIAASSEWEQPYTLAELKKMKVDELAAECAAENVEVWGEVSKVQPPKPFYREKVMRTTKERNSQILRIADEVAHMNAYRDGMLPLIKNPTKDCAWDCDFFELCKVHEAGGDVEDYKRMGFKTEDPYADHRDNAENSKKSVAANVRTAGRK